MTTTCEYQKWLRLPGITPETQVCVNCSHFHQHYDKCGFRIFAGHCLHPRKKYCEPLDSCGHFENKNALPSGANT